MKKIGNAIYLGLLMVVWAIVGNAQVGNPSIISVTTAPSGACSAGLPNQQVTSTGVQYSCQAGTWGAIGGSGGTVTGVTATAPVTSTGGTAPVIACATCGVTTSPLNQFSATTSAQLAAILSDETGTGVVVFSASPALTGTPTAPTPAIGTNTTQLATMAAIAAATVPCMKISNPAGLVNSGTTVFNPTCGQMNWSTNEADRTDAMPRSGTIQNLYACVHSQIGASGSMTVSIDTGTYPATSMTPHLTITFPANAVVGSCQTSTGTLAYTAGQAIDFTVTNNSGTSNSPYFIYAEFVNAN